MSYIIKIAKNEYAKNDKNEVLKYDNDEFDKCVKDMEFIIEHWINIEIDEVDIIKIDF